MRILLTSPFAHPYVRRGVERHVTELSRWLARRGHDVTLVTTSPDDTQTLRPEQRLTVIYRRTGHPFGRGRARVDDLLRTTPTFWRTFLMLDWFEVAETHHYPDAAALRLTPRRPVRHFLMRLPGAPNRAALGGRPLNRLAAVYAMRGASRRFALSRYAAERLREEFGLSADVLPPGVDTDQYLGEKPGSEEELILCTAAADDPRKRVPLLVEAFVLLAGLRPGVRLALAPPSPAAAEVLVAQVDPPIRDRIEIVRGLALSDLAALYQRATVTVLPSVEEAFGLTLVESLAAGTPVVGTNHGGIPDIVDDEAIGRLFAADDVGELSRALSETLDLATDPTSADVCRKSARRWDWSVIGPRVEEAYAAAC